MGGLIPGGHLTHQFSSKDKDKFLMILKLGSEERRNEERSEELAKATNELASEEFLWNKNPTRTGKYIYTSRIFPVFQIELWSKDKTCLIFRP